MWLFIFHNQKESFLSFPQYGEPSTSDKWRLAFLTLYLVCARAHVGGCWGRGRVETFLFHVQLHLKR